MKRGHQPASPLAVQSFWISYVHQCPTRAKDLLHKLENQAAYHEQQAQSLRKKAAVIREALDGRE